MAMTLNELILFSNKFLKDNYNMTLNIPLQLNGRLKTVKGKFVWTTRNRTPLRVELNREFVENNDTKMVLDVLCHELIHYAVFMLGKPHSDGDTYFENELRRLGIVSQRTINKYKIVSKMQVYQCTRCNYEFKKSRRLQHNGKYHRCNCGGSLKDMGKKMIAM